MANTKSICGVCGPLREAIRGKFLRLQMALHWSKKLDVEWKPVFILSKGGNRWHDFFNATNKTTFRNNLVIYSKTTTSENLKIDTHT